MTNTVWLVLCENEYAGEASTVEMVCGTGELANEVRGLMQAAACVGVPLRSYAAIASFVL